MKTLKGGPLSAAASARTLPSPIVAEPFPADHVLNLHRLALGVHCQPGPVRRRICYVPLGSELKQMQSIWRESEGFCFFSQDFTHCTHEASSASTKFWPIMRCSLLIS